jgi:hypothetical protein
MGDHLLGRVTHLPMTPRFVVGWLDNRERKHV